LFSKKLFNEYCSSIQKMLRLLKWVAGDLTPSRGYGGASRAPISKG